MHLTARADDMLDLGWSELLIIGVVALIVVGPKDLPKMLRTLGQYAGRAKGIAREFQRSMDDAARQADIEELRDIKKGLDDMRDAQHKMQRDLGQSFLDNPPKSPKDESVKTPATKTPAPKKAGGDATLEAAKTKAPKPVKKSVKKSAEKPGKPQAESGSVSGA
jgi:sec-independent protein translocase protein TatB